MGYSQVVRQWFLVPSCAGSNPANPIKLKAGLIGPVFFGYNKDNTIMK